MLNIDQERAVDILKDHEEDLKELMSLAEDLYDRPLSYAFLNLMTAIQSIAQDTAFCPYIQNLRAIFSSQFMRPSFSVFERAMAENPHDWLKNVKFDEMNIDQIDPKKHAKLIQTFHILKNYDTYDNYHKYMNNMIFRSCFEFLKVMSIESYVSFIPKEITVAICLLLLKSADFMPQENVAKAFQVGVPSESEQRKARIFNAQIQPSYGLLKFGLTCSVDNTQEIQPRNIDRLSAEINLRVKIENNQYKLDFANFKDGALVMKFNSQEAAKSFCFLCEGKGLTPSILIESVVKINDQSQANFLISEICKLDPEKIYKELSGFEFDVKSEEKSEKKVDNQSCRVM